MKCPFCGNKTSTITKKEPKENHLFRRRVCGGCGLTYSTYEVVVPATLKVKKRKTRARTNECAPDDFNRTKLMGSILLAFDRDNADEKAIDIGGRVMRELANMRKAVLPSSVIGQIVEQALLEREEVGAELRFAILHEHDRLSSIEQVLKEVDKVKDKVQGEEQQQPLVELKAEPGPPDVCPYCGSPDTSVVTTRLSPDKAPEDHRLRRAFKAPPGGHVLRRRRECNDCETRYVSHEMTWAFTPFTVIKTDGTREPFDYHKLTESILNAWGKSAIDEDISRIARDVTSEIASVPRPRNEIPSWDIGDIVLRHLRDGGHDMALVRYRLRHRGVGRERERRKIEEVEAILKEIQREKQRRLGKVAPAIERPKEG